MLEKNMYNQGNHAFGIELSTFCGAKCVMCPQDTFKRKREFMSEKTFKKTVDEFINIGVFKINIGSFGDVLMDPHFAERIEYIKTKYPETQLSLVTTGQLLYGARVEAICAYIDLVKISHYGMSKNVFEAVHRGSLVFEKCKKNVDDFLSLEKRPYTIASFLVLSENQSELEEWKAYYEPKADAIDIWKPYVHPDTRERLLPAPEKLCSKAITMNNIHVATDGTVYVCCYDYNAELSLGNINENTMQELLDSARTKHIIEIHKNKAVMSSAFSVCKNCDMLRDRSDALVYTNRDMKVGELSMKIKGAPPPESIL